MNGRPAWAEVDLGAVAHNVNVLRELVAPSKVCAVVKAYGYGHGAVPVARAALKGGADLLAVALVAEGVELRAAGIEGPIIVLSQASAPELVDLVSHDLDATVYTAQGVADLARAAAEGASAGPVRAHLKVDTGMHRVGAQPSDALDLCRQIVDDDALLLASVFTHCAVADEVANPFTGEQIRRYEAVLAELDRHGIEVPCRHAANTAAAIAHPPSRFDIVRCGIGIYGLAPSPEMTGMVELRPAMSLRARVTHVKRIAAGEAVSYGQRFRADVATNIATVGLGYADGVDRRLGLTGGEVLIRGERLQIAGSVTMDQLMVDCGDRPIAVGDEVVLIGEQDGQEITADEWAQRLGTINYEIVCGVSPRVPRRYEET